MLHYYFIVITKCFFYFRFFYRILKLMFNVFAFAGLVNVHSYEAHYP